MNTHPIDLKELEMVISTRAFINYLNADHLYVYKEGEFYTVIGSIERNNLTAKELNALLIKIGDKI